MEPTANDELGRAKRAEEKFRVSVNFSTVVEQGDAVASSAVTAKRMDTWADATVDVIESPVNNGNVVIATFKGGVDGRDYLFRFRATTTAGDVFVHTLKTMVRGA